MDEPLTQTFKQHWPEYLMEAWGLGTFMISACFFTALLEHPGSSVHHWIPDPFIRRLLVGIAMGLSAIFIILSPWGKRSGGHLNPSLTWTFFRLKKISFGDAFFYSIAQFFGGVLGVLLCALFIRAYLEHPAVHYAATLPGPAGIAIAFVAEAAISFVLMFTVLFVSNHSRLSRYTVFFVATLIALYITFEAPLSGMSMNPARSVGSAFFANDWRSIWIYFAGPLLGMLLAAETYLRTKGLHEVFCAKLNHHNDQRCIFQCNFGTLIKQSNSKE